MGSERWWSERNAPAFTKFIGVSLGQADGVSLTKLTTRQLRVKYQRFQLVEEVSPDALYFPFDKGAFMAEKERHASNMHCAKEGLGYDLHRLQTGIAL